MHRISSIMMRSTSGFCSLDEAYSETLTIKKNSIRYVYAPVLKIEGHDYKRWAYSVVSTSFAELFEKAAIAAGRLLYIQEEVYCCDCREFRLRITFEDKKTVTKTFDGVPNGTTELWKFFSQMIPGCETLPLMMNE